MHGHGISTSIGLKDFKTSARVALPGQRHLPALSWRWALCGAKPLCRRHFAAEKDETQELGKGKQGAAPPVRHLAPAEPPATAGLLL